MSEIKLPDWPVIKMHTKGPLRALTEFCSHLQKLSFTSLGSALLPRVQRKLLRDRKIRKGEGGEGGRKEGRKLE